MGARDGLLNEYRVSHLTQAIFYSSRPQNAHVVAGKTEKTYRHSVILRYGSKITIERIFDAEFGQLRNPTD